MKQRGDKSENIKVFKEMEDRMRTFIYVVFVLKKRIEKVKMGQEKQIQNTKERIWKTSREKA